MNECPSYIIYLFLYIYSFTHSLSYWVSPFPLRFIIKVQNFYECHTINKWLCVRKMHSHMEILGRSACTQTCETPAPTDISPCGCRIWAIESKRWHAQTNIHHGAQHMGSCKHSPPPCLLDNLPPACSLSKHSLLTEACIASPSPLMRSTINTCN